ncbi:hypothetical protein [Streptomyces abikoensis]|uniref:hypothetical protein n=1 Tax=Streptomyces abikoensis TaxID=97398 RepID=UPI00367836F2
MQQWTNRNGGTYGDESYGGGYDYGYPHAHGGGATTGTVAAPRNTADTALWPGESHWAHPDATAATDATTAWQAHAALDPDLIDPDLVVRDPQAPGPQAPAPYNPPPYVSIGLRNTSPDEAPREESHGSDAPDAEEVRPVFVDSSGRRQRHVRRAARLLVIPAGGYVALLVSSMLGGPAVSSPTVPLSQNPRPAAPVASEPATPSADRPTPTAKATPRTTAPTVKAAPRPAATTRTAPTAAATAAPPTTAPRTAKGHAFGAGRKS